MLNNFNSYDYGGTGQNTYDFFFLKEEDITNQIPKKDDFIMLPTIDFAFKLLFGNVNNKKRLISLLSAILKLPVEDFLDLELLNPEIEREFEEDKKAILDIRVKLKTDEQINIEIQVSPFSLMPERSLFYWSKMYTNQIKKGKSFEKLKKCITINILDYRFIKTDKIHTIYNTKEIETNELLSHVLEIHFIDLEKLRQGLDRKNKIDKELLKWLKFLSAKTKGEMEMEAKKDIEINEAYEELKRISLDDRNRMIYEAREAFLLDQLTRESLARKEGKEVGITEGKAEAIRKMTLELLRDNVDIELISKYTKLTKEEIEEIKKQ